MVRREWVQSRRNALEPFRGCKNVVDRALKVVGVEVEMVIYPRQPHGVREPRLQQDVLERNLNWFNHWLLGLEPPAREQEEVDEGHQEQGS